MGPQLRRKSCSLNFFWVKTELAIITQGRTQSVLGHVSNLNSALTQMLKSGSRKSIWTITSDFDTEPSGGKNNDFCVTTEDVRSLCKEGRLKEALHTLDLMDQQDSKACSDTYVCLLQACINMKALAEGKQVHAHIIRSGLKINTFLGNTLINLYAKCGSMLDARQMFDKMPQRNVFTWTLMIALYSKYRPEEAFKLFWQMEHAGLKADKVTFLSVLKACTTLKEGKHIHARIIKSGFESHVFVASTLVDMYAKCGSIENARQVFDKMPLRNVVSYNAMITGYAQHGHDDAAFQVFQQMECEHVKPNKITFFSVLSAFSSPVALKHGKQIHACIIKSGYESDIMIGNALVAMYAKCGSIEDARHVFDRMPERDVISWTVMIAGYAQYGHSVDAFKLLSQMQEDGIPPNNVTFISILKTCASLELGKQIHEYVIKNGFESDVCVGNTLVNMYAKCGSVDDAHHAFDRMPKRDAILWTTLITAYSQKGYAEEALKLFWQMQQESVKPDKVTFVSILNACGKVAALEQGKWIHAQIIDSGLESDVFVGSTLVDMYAKCGSISHAREIFDKMPIRNVVTWTAMLTGYAQLGHDEEAFKLFQQMLDEGLKPDRVTFISILNACTCARTLEQGKQIHAYIVKSGLELDDALGCSLINMYANCGSIADACRVFDTVPKNDLVSWTSMVAGYTKHGHYEDALKLFWQMEQGGVKPNEVTFVTVMSACARLASLEQGKQIHAHIIKSGFESNVSVGNSLIDMYAKCGSMKHASLVFNKMLQRNVVSWTAIIAGHTQHEDGEAALRLFWQMTSAGVKPDELTFVIVLKACAMLAALEQGKQIHAHIARCGLESDVFIASALLDMYAKCGSIEHAQQVFAKMTERNVVSWTTMIAGYAWHGYGNLALQLVEQMQHGGAKVDHITFISVISACNHSGLMDLASHYFDSMDHDYGMTPMVEHYACMVNLFGRAGCLEEAQELIKKMPLRPTTTVWMALLSACRIHGNMELAKCAASCIVKLEPQNTSAFVLLSNIYAMNSRWEEKAKVIKIMEDR